MKRSDIIYYMLYITNQQRMSLVGELGDIIYIYNTEIIITDTQVTHLPTLGTIEAHQWPIVLAVRASHKA